MRKSILHWLVIVLLSVLFIQNETYAQAFSFRVAGASNTYIMGINDYQWVAGYYTDATGTHGFVYKGNDTILVSYPGAANTYFYDINIFGEVVGAYNSGSANNNVGFIYNIYTQTATTITSWISGYQQIIPYKITNVGDVVGSYKLSTNNWIFTIIAGINTGSLHYNYNPTYGVGMNSQDQVVGFYINGGQNHGFIRSLGGTYTSFDYPGAFKTRAHGINDSAVIIGEFNSTHGFIYKTTAPASFTEILLPDALEVHPYDINNNGIAAGFFKDNTGAMAGFILMDKFVPELGFDNINLTNKPVGVVADGKAIIKLIINRTSGNSTINSIKIELMDKNNQPNIPLGKMKGGQGVTDSTVVIFNNPSGTNQWTFYYVAPDIYVNNLNDYTQYREVKARITFHNNANNTNFQCEQLIKVIRVPVLLVHGLKSEGAAFKNCADYLVATGRYTNDFVNAVDYKATNSVAFTSNSYVLPTNILLMKDQCHKLGYEMKQVDVVAHSMGAILARLYLQGNDYQFDVHKLIPVNSPLSGSQGANLLAELPDPIRSFAGIAGEAFTDLGVESFAINELLNGPRLNFNVVPSHTITSTATNFSPIFGSSILGASLYLSFKIKYGGYILEEIPPMIYDGPSDLVVAENSQYAGCIANSHIDNEWHCGICSNPTAEDEIKALLEVSVNGLFTMAGFNPPKLYWNEEKKAPAIKQKNITDTVNFIYPPPGLTKANGDTLNIHIASTAGIHDLIVYIRKSQDSVFLIDTVGANLNLTWTVPLLSCGKVPMYLIGIDASNQTVIDSTYIVVEPSATADSIFISSPSDSLILAQGLPKSIYVSCLYSDSIVRDITSHSDISYQVQSNKAISLGDGIFKGLQAGRDTVIISFSGMSLSFPIHVGSYYPKYDTIITDVDICSGQTYTFNGQVLDTAGTYSYSLINQYGNDSTLILHLGVSNTVPVGAGVITGLTEVSPGQTGVIYTVPLIQNALNYVWTLPTGVTGNSISNTISLDFGLIGDSCILMVNGINGCGSGTTSSLVIYQLTKATLSGNISYNNTASTPLNATTVVLKQNGNIIYQTTADQNGNYLFENIDYGQYQVSVSTNKAWGGVNAVDALTIMNHFVGSISLTGLRLTGADVNNSSSINSADALLALRRFVGLIPGFIPGDWLWDTDGETLTINGNLTLNIKGLCYGDVNGSYTP